MRACDILSLVRTDKLPKTEVAIARRLILKRISRLRRQLAKGKYTTAKKVGRKQSVLAGLESLVGTI